MLGVRLSHWKYEISSRPAFRLRAGRYSRRRFLGAALLAVLLGGCGGDEAAEAPATEADVLEALLRHERAAGAIAAGVPSAVAIAREDRAHAARLEAALGRRPGRGPYATADLAVVLARKQTAVFAYVNALPRLADPGLRALVMQLAASEAEQLAALRLATGAEPVPDAFAGVTGP